MGGSELNLLRAMIHYRRFDLLTHPVCELFLHLKLLRGRWLYWFMMCLHLVFTILVMAWSLISYGEIGQFLNRYNLQSMDISNNSTTYLETEKSNVYYSSSHGSCGDSCIPDPRTDWLSPCCVIGWQQSSNSTNPDYVPVQNALAVLRGVITFLSVLILLIFLLKIYQACF